MASNSPEPSSSTEANHVAEEILSQEVRSFCEVNYGDDNGIEFHGENFVNHFKTEGGLVPVVSYGHFSIDPCSSTGTYAQVSLPSYSSVSQVTTSNQNDFHEVPDPESSHDQESFLSHHESKRVTLQPISTSELLQAHQSDSVASPANGNILLHEDSVDSHHSQVPDADDDLERVSLSVDHLNLQHVSIIHPNLSNIGSLPILLDRNTLNALIASSRNDASFTLDISTLPHSLLPSQGIAQRNESAHFLTSDASMSGMSHSMLPPMLSQKDILTSMIASSSTSTSSNSVGNSFPINHKQMLAQKYAAEMLEPTTSASLINDLRDQQLIESMSDRTSSPYVVASSANSLIGSNNIAVYDDHVVSLPSTSVSQCLPMDVYAIDRGVALVTSSRDSPESVMNGNVEFVSHPSSHPSVQNYVSSSVDLVHSHSLEHGMHCAVDSTVGPKLHQNDENIVDSSDGYNQSMESSDNVLHTTTGGDYCHIADMNSCDDGTGNEAVTSVLNSSAGLEANEALSSTNHRFSSHSQFSADIHNSVDELHGCATVSSATHPDSTRSPEEISENSNGYSLPSTSISDSTDIVQSEYSRPRRDLRSNRHWCEDCGTFYDKECTQHRIQLIFDKPVLSRAWASLPASYLYVNKIGIDEGEPVYGVFAKKTIPKRTQFGPIEGILVKREDPPSDDFILVVEHDGVPLYLDTSDESMSNWMRFVRPADTHKEQNLVLVQQGQSLYFNTTRSINPKTELRIWYSPVYAEKYGLPVLEPNEEEKKALEEQENAWPCFECNQRFSSSEDLQKHLNQHDEENESASGPKTRLKTRAKAKLAKKSQFGRLRPIENGTESAEGIFIRKARGRPPKKYKVSLGLLEEATLLAPTSKRPRGRPPKKYKLPSKQEDYKCDICYKSFPRNYSLQRHSIMHTGEKKFKCPICDLRFSHVYNRNRHVRKHKRDEDDPQAMKPVKSLFKKKQGAEWVCTHCGLTFDNSSVLNLHTLTHAAEDVAFNEFWDNTIGEKEGFEFSEDSKLGLCKCPECTQEFPNRRDLIEHASVHGKILKQRCYRGIINPLKPFKCNLCYKSFASDERLIRHYLVHGSEDSKPLQCEICYKRFLNNSALACHIKVHSEERKFYECPICKSEFDQIVALKEHVHIHCENGVYNCPSCHKVFEEYNQVRKHIRAFHSERRYPCDMCEKVFPRPDKLKLHMLRHSDHREFLCANCGKQFKRKDKLKEHMKRMHAPDREAKVNAKNSNKSGSKKFVPKVSPTDYHRFIYKCHTCLLGFKRRGMLVNHLAKRHPDIRPESVPELNLPILKTTRDYYCQYCEKVYKSSSKRKAHILKNHPGAELPMSNRKKVNLQGGVPEVPGLPNPTFSQTVGSITTHPHHCNWCHKQYASKAKLLQHQRKKHMDMLSLSYVANTTKVEPGCDQGTQINGQIVIEGIPSSFAHEAAAVLIDATKRKIQFVDKDTLVVSTHPDGLPTADLLTQAMSELTQTLVEYRTNEDFLTGRLSHSTPATLVNPSPSTTPIPHSPDEDSPDSPPPVLDNSITTPLDPIQLNQLLAQYHEQQLSPSQVQQLAVVVTPVPRAWPTVTTSLGNYPAR